MSKFLPDYAVKPWETIHEAAQERQISNNQLAKALNLVDLKPLISGQKEIDGDLAKRLKDLLGIEETFWLNLDKNYRSDLKRLKTTSESGLASK